MRENSFSFIEIAEKCLDIFGEISRSIAWIVSLVLAPALHQKIEETRSSGLRHALIIDDENLRLWCDHWQYPLGNLE